MTTRTPRLSTREREIIDLAAAGNTDAGIAHKLGISIPTVGTYWNRIRVKVGPYSRTELVAIVLMEDSRLVVEDLRATYEAMIAQMQQQISSWRLLVENAPDAILLVDSEGTIREANSAADTLFGYVQGELIGLPIRNLVPTTLRDQHMEHVNTYLNSPDRRRMMDHVGTLAVRKDGSEFLIAADLNGFTDSGQQLVACVVRAIAP